MRRRADQASVGGIGGVACGAVVACALLAGGAQAAHRWGAANAMTQVQATARDIAYGSDPAQRFDVYAPADPHGAPTILLVHGGGWQRGDKAAAGVVDAKVKHWTARGAFVVSVGYRMLPEADPVTQARDVATALAAAQREIQARGGDPARFVAMGHSAGAHLVALLAAAPDLVAEAHARPVLGSVLLDSAAVDVVALMEQPHLPLYDRAFGSDARDWVSASPMQRMQRAPAPILAVCSSQRRASCPANIAFLDRIHAFGGRASLLSEPLTHQEINVQLGQDNAYTRAVDDFLATLGVGARAVR